MPVATVVGRQVMVKDIRERSVIQRFSIPTVLATVTSAVYELPIDRSSGTIALFRIAALNNVAFSFSLLTKVTGVLGGIDEILRVGSIAQFYQESFLNIQFMNTDGPQKDSLYIIVTNADAVTATGIIAIEVVLN